MNLAGVFAPIPTPFDEQDQVDTKRLRAALERWMAGPLTGVVVLGSNGEAALMDDFESDRAIVAAREAVPRGRPFIVGTGRESTQAAVRAAKRAGEHGADAVLVRTPGFFKTQMTTDAFVRHYTAVADGSPVPVLLYNFTAVTGVNLLPAAVTRLAGHPNIIGMKESGGDVAQIADLVSGTPEDFVVLAGSLATFYASLCVGATGGILAPACIVPESIVRLFELTRAGRHADAVALQRELIPLARLLGLTYGVPGLKAALNLIGFDVGVPRPPLAPAPEAAIAALREAIAHFEEIPA
jgi:dihydrodipicolinate synthase/N-acetylneuraminate lyase